MITLNHDPDTYVTPVELRNGRWYKREDLLRFSNGVNGKVRTTLHLAQKARDAGADALVYGGSVHAPALGRVASAAAYLGMDCYLAIGSDIRTARRHDTTRVAEEAGAEFLRSKVAYNPALQKLARETAERSGGSIVQVPYGVSHPDSWTPDEVRSFLHEDSWQVGSVLDTGIETLVVPFGSANAALGILYGIASYLQTMAEGVEYRYGLERVVLVGVGPDRREWLWERLRYVGVTKEQLPEVTYLPLHPHFAEYKDRMPEHQDGIDFHPTYEGKVVRFLDTIKPTWWTARDEGTCMWIVGGPL